MSYLRLHLSSSADGIVIALQTGKVNVVNVLYAGCNIQHFAELLAEREVTALFRSSVRRIHYSSGISHINS